jgi:catechol 2,3-dioxygenase-like lactoylglutathione lyase family enzyme
MRQRIAHVTLIVTDYDEAIAFYTQKLHFTVVEDSYRPAQALGHDRAARVGRRNDTAPRARREAGAGEGRGRPPRDGTA